MTPTLVMVGEYDRLYESNIELFGHLGAPDKAFLGIECASHFMAWEMQRHVLHKASGEWLTSATLTGKNTGTRSDCTIQAMPRQNREGTAL